jgi:hypothetical protein
MHRARRRLSTAVALLVLAYGGVALQAVTVVLTFDQETPGLKHGSPIRGVALSGVTFDFTRNGLPSNDAFFGGVIHNTPGGPARVLTFVHEPALEGNAQGVLTMIFTTPTVQLRFGIAESVSPASATVQTFDDRGRLIATTAVTMNPSGNVSEGSFNVTAPAGRAVKSAVVSFPNAPLNSRFAIDDLTFVVP